MQEIRIVAGELRRRKLRVLPGTRIRPTSDRVREALFNILGPGLGAVRVLDAFAGTGALGLEALSRGALHATFLESDREVLELLRDNIDRLGVAARSHVVPGPAEQSIGRPIPGERFEIVLADPPYFDPVRELFFSRLCKSRILSPGATVVMEGDARSLPLAVEGGPLTLTRSARYGGTRLDFYALRQP